MPLLPFEASHAGMVAEWLARDDTARWLDFGAGVRSLAAASLAVMAQRDIHVLRLFAAPSGEPIGLVALSDIARDFGTARLWYALGNRSYGGRGYTSGAVAELLRHGFESFGLQAVSAWAVEGNTPSIRILRRHGFSLVGRLRRSHVVNGRHQDRLLFDLLAEEFRSGGNGS